MSLVFFINGPGAKAKILANLPLTIIRTSLTEVQKMKLPYLSSWVTNEKIRTLSFLQLSKFEKAKCPYFYVCWPRSSTCIHVSMSTCLCV